MKNSIRNWLISPLLGLCVIPFALLSAFFAYHNYTVEKERALNLQDKITELTAKNISFYLHEQEIKILFMLQQSFLPNLSPDMLHRLFTHFLNISNADKHEYGTSFQEIILLDKTGRETVYASTTKVTNPGALNDWSDSQEFINAVGKNGIYYSPIYFSDKTGEPLLKLSVAIRDLRTLELQGVLVAEMSFKLLWHLVEDFKIGPKGFAYVVDWQGQVLAHPNRSVVLRKTFFEVPAIPTIMKGISDEKAVITTKRVNLGRRTLFFVIENPASEALKHIMHSIQIIGAFLLFILCGTVGLGFIIISQLVKPIEKLAVTARKITAGDFSQQAELKRMDELGDLAISFNSMTARMLKTIKALKKERNFVHSVIESLTHPFFVIDMEDYRIKLANSAAGFGELTGNETCYQLTHNIDKPCDGVDHPCTIKEIREHGKPVVVEHTHVMADGSKRIFEVYGYPIFDDDENVSQVIEYNIDITEKKILEEQLRQAQKMEAIGTLAGGIAHDFNNILSAIVGYSDLAKMTMNNHAQLERNINEVLKAADRAKNLVRQILTFSRKTGQERQALQVSLLVKEVLKLLRSTIPTTIEIKQDIITSEALVLADPTHIHQILMNLCTNAYHAMRETGGTLEVTLKDVELTETTNTPELELAPGRYIQLVISDTGIGMDKETKAKIFEPYFTTKGLGEGTGLGLAVVHGIVTSHGGSIHVTSELKKGTTFSIYLPVYEGEHEAIKPDKQNVPLLGGHETIMLVDDERAILDIASEFLKSQGYTVYVFSNGVQACQDFQKQPHKYDLVITDMTMPFMTGIQLSLKLLEIRPDIPIILCTGYSEIITREKSLAIGIKEYIEKPLNYDNLFQTIRVVLDSSIISGVRILFVDDVQFNIDLGKNVLNRLGCDVVGSSSGQEALEMFTRDPGKFDVIITDQDMPNMTGLELTKHVLEIRPDMPILLLSGDEDNLDKQFVKSSGIREILEKPLDVNIITNAISRSQK